MAKYRVLSLDGGGIRGLISIILMQRLIAVPGLEGWLDQVDLVAGTSTGGLIALAIARGIDLRVVRALYKDKGKEIFEKSWLDVLGSLWTIIGAEYDNKSLTRELKQVIGETTLGQLQKHVLITAFDLDNEDPDPNKRTWKPKLFHNLPGEGNDADRLAYKVALYTSAAPTYFPTVDGYIDGGVFAANPSMCALAQTQDRRSLVRPDLSEVVLFSVGTGTSLTYVEGQNLDWGYAQWVKPLIGILLDGVAGIADYQCKQVLGERYIRLAPTFPPGVSIDMDEVDRLDEMISFANAVDLEETVAWLKSSWV
jgi:patatin-like phospholipase/acyl hydrolase